MTLRTAKAAGLLLFSQKNVFVRTLFYFAGMYCLCARFYENLLDLKGWYPLVIFLAEGMFTGVFFPGTALLSPSIFLSQLTEYNLHYCSVPI